MPWSDNEVEALHNAHATHNGNWNRILQDNHYKILHSRTPEALRCKIRRTESRKKHTPQKEILEARSTIHLSPNSDDVHPCEPNKIDDIPLDKLFWDRLKARNVVEATCGWLSSTHLELFCKRLMQQRKETDRWLVLDEIVFRSLLYGLCNAIYGNGKKNRFKVWWEVDKIFSPICIDKEHWVLGQLDLRQWSLTTYNSLNDDHYRESVKQMSKKFENRLPEYLDKIGYWVEKEKPAKFKLEHIVENVPQQVGGRDCGVFVCWFMESLIKAEPLKMGITDESRRDFATKNRDHIASEICKIGTEETSSTREM